MTADNQEKKKITSNEEVVSPRTPSAMQTSLIDLGHIEVLQILNEHGEVDKGLEPNINDERLFEVYRAMVLARIFDERMLTMQRQGKMGTFAPNIGQEACIIGQVTSLSKEDWFSPSYRSFGAQIMRGWPMEHLMRLWAGFHDGFPPPDGVNDLPFSIVIGSHVLPAVGIGMGMNYKENKNCVVVNYGDGASSQGAVSEALNFAGVYNAPVVFVCENNGWAISTPTSQQSANQILAAQGVAHGIPSIRVDGNDILAMMSATEEARNRARNGEGPTLIEAITFRMSLHTTADDPTVYRDENEVQIWKSRCPITRFEVYLTNKGILNSDRVTEVKESCERDVIKARDTFYAMEPADPSVIFDYLYEVLPPELQEQRREYLNRLQQKGVNG